MNILNKNILYKYSSSISTRYFNFNRNHIFERNITTTTLPVATTYKLGRLMLTDKEKEYESWDKSLLVRRIVELERKLRKSEEVSYTKPFDFSKYDTRFVVLKFAYLGWPYTGLMYLKHEKDAPTVEGQIIDVLYKCRLIPSKEIQEFKLARCGRTDKGVSALNQVISLHLRSKLTKEEQMDPQNDSKELNYASILNSNLPKDIRVSQVCLRPPEDFDARYSCRGRHYKYLFDKQDLDLDIMRKAAKYFVGDHDFRNFCKLDGSKQLENFTRTIISADIIPAFDTNKSNNDGINSNIYCFDLKGASFLWHQVRCMMAILFLVGQKLESPEIIKYLLDVKSNPKKPHYQLTSSVPLMLYDCFFDDMEWIPAVTPAEIIDHNPMGKRVERSKRGWYALWHEHLMKEEVSRFMYNMLIQRTEEAAVDTSMNTEEPKPDVVVLNLGDGEGSQKRKYVPIKDRAVMDSIEVLNARWMQKKRPRSE